MREVWDESEKKETHRSGKERSAFITTNESNNGNSIGLNLKMAKLEPKLFLRFLHH